MIHIRSKKPLNEECNLIMMDAQMLLNGISRSLFATADDELRPVMNGIYFDIHTDDLTFVASDGHKLVRLRNLSVKSPERASFILPKKPANLLKAFYQRKERWSASSLMITMLISTVLISKWYAT